MALNTDPVIREAIRLRDGLLEAAKEFGYIKGRAEADKQEAKAQLAEIDARVCLDAAAMLEKLGTEVTRLRLGIQCFNDMGDPTKAQLNSLSKNWNDSK